MKAKKVKKRKSYKKSEKNTEKYKKPGKTYKIAFFLFFFAVLAVFYPGAGYYQKIFSFDRQLFTQNKKIREVKIRPVPVVINPDMQPVLSAQAVYVVDLDSFTPIYSRNINLKLFPASTAKVITALVAWDIYDLDQVLTVSNPLSEGSTMNLVMGEKITFENLLYGILIQSANDAAYTLAQDYSGGFDEFVTLMNKKSKEIGMKDTFFTNPAGLDEPGQHTTAFDLALAARELMKNKTLSKMVSIKSITVSDSEFKYFHPLYNVNKLLGEVAGIGGLKTGSTPNAGENLITFYKKNGNRFLIVILKSEDRFSDTENIVNWIEGNVEFIDINSNL